MIPTMEQISCAHGTIQSVALSFHCFIFMLKVIMENICPAGGVQSRSRAGGFYFVIYIYIGVVRRIDGASQFREDSRAGGHI